ncbi:MFS transporter [Cupriavidus necator]
MKHVDIYDLAGKAKFSRLHILVLSWCMLILVLDGYDLAVVGVALPVIMKEMGVDARSAGFMASSALFGMMFGAMLFGMMADRMGRPLLISVCIALFSIMTAAAGLTKDPISFSVTRFLAGLGIGGVLPIVTAQMAEYAPEKMRARLVTLVFAGYAVGGILVALTGKHLIDSYGWQSVFFSAGLPVFLIPLIMSTMPESMSHLIKHGREAELRNILNRLGADLRSKERVQDAIATGTRVANGRVRDLVQDGCGFSTVMIWIAFATALFTIYALSSWLTKLMAMSGYNLGSALNFVIVYNLGAMIGGVGGGLLGDKFNTKYVLVSFYAVGGAALTTMAYIKSTELMFVMVFVVGASTLGTQLLAYAYASEFYSHKIRATGIGFAAGFGRVGAVVGPVLIGWLVSLNLPLERNFLAIGVSGLLGTIAAMLINHKRSSSNKNLNEEVGSQQSPVK